MVEDIKPGDAKLGNYVAKRTYIYTMIFAAAFILYGLVFGLQAARRAAPPAVIETLTALGVLIYAGVGVVAMLRGGNFLEYGWLLDHHHATHGQHLGILVVELGVGITVASVMILIFFSFAGRERAQ